MDVTTATAFITSNKGEMITVQTADANHFGEALSVNSKGINIKVDGKTRSFAIARVAALFLGDVEDEGDLTTRLDEVANEISEGATTAEVAAALSEVMEREITPKELRVHLRALGLGVGKGRKYALSAGELRAVHNVITEADTAAAAAN